MPEVKLNYAAAVGLAQKMKSSANQFESNQKSLDQNVKTLKASWSGSASDVMQQELQDMNKYVVQLQASLKGMADFVTKAAETLKETDSASSVNWGPILSVLGQFGIIGGIASTTGSAAQNDSVAIGKGLLGVLGEGAKLVGKMIGKTSTVSPFGLGKTVDAIGFAENLAMKLDGYIINNSYNANNLSAAQKTANNIGAYAKWGGVALTAVGSFVSNIKEFDSDIKNPRLWAETAGETAVSVGSGILIGAGVAAIAGATAPAWAVGVVAVGTSLAVDWGVKQVTGLFGEEKGLSELVSDTVIDSVVAVGKVAKSVGKAVGDGVSKAGKAIASWFS